MEDKLLIEPKFKNFGKRKTARQRRKEKQDKIGVGIMIGSAAGGGSAIYKTAKDRIEKEYGSKSSKKRKEKKTGGLIRQGKPKLAKKGYR